MALFPDSVINHSVELYTSRISAKSRTIYWIIIISILALFGILPFIHVDISVQARGQFQSAIEKQVINSPGQGRVVYTAITNGNSVKAGDTLFFMDSGGIEAQLSSLMDVMEGNESSIHDLEILAGMSESRLRIGTGGLMTPRYSSELISFITQFELQNQKHERSRTDYERSRILFEQLVISKAEHENSRNNYNIEKRELDQLMAYQLAVWQSDLSVRRDEARRYEAELEMRREELKNRIITSPIDGTIIHSIDIQKSSFLSPGQTIAEISPDSELAAVFYVKPSDIGFIRIGQEVRFQVDAYNYHQWGMLNGFITDISGDLISDGTSAYFRVRCMPEDKSLSLKNGFTSEVIKGMTFTARVMVTRRSLLELLFDKADKWFNPYQSTNEKAVYAG